MCWWHPKPGCKKTCAETQLHLRPSILSTRAPEGLKQRFVFYIKCLPLLLTTLVPCDFAVLLVLLLMFLVRTKPPSSANKADCVEILI